MSLIGRLLCRAGFHKWTLPYPYAGDYDWCGGAGHHRAHCLRDGCAWIRKWQPGDKSLNHMRTLPEKPKEMT